jgi:hypothetical protein
MHAESLALAAVTAEQHARTAAVNAVAAASEMLEGEGPHGLCLCQRVSLLAALEATLGGFAIKVFESSLARAQEIKAGSYAIHDADIPGLIEQYIVLDPEGLGLVAYEEHEGQERHTDPFAGNDGHSVASIRLEDITTADRGVVDRVNDYTGGQYA